MSNSRIVQLRSWFLVVFIGISCAAQASPQTRVVNNPSSIIIFVTNLEDRPYTCVINMKWSHDSFGQRKQETVSTTAGVAAKAEDAVLLKLAGAWVNVKIDEGPEILCS